MPYTPAVLAMVFDFDDTLVPDSTTKLLTSAGIDTERFWRTDAQALVAAGYDPPLAYLKLLLEMVGPDKPLGNLSVAKLKEFGAGLDGDFYPGLPDILGELRAAVHEYRDMSIEFYIISGGLEHVIEGSKAVRDNFDGWYGCLLEDDQGTGCIGHIRRCITFTEKTRYLFEINKGIPKVDSATNPYLVNKDLPQADRRIPFKNMIYVGDGLTDIPCFSLVKNQGGVAFGVFQPGEESSAKKAFLEFLQPGRVVGVYAPRYRSSDELGSLLRAAVAARCGQIYVDRKGA
jgi:phosphoserine phosphatase